MAMVYFLVHFSCYESFKSDAERIAPLLTNLPGLAPFGYVLLVIFLLLISLFYKVGSPQLKPRPK